MTAETILTNALLVLPEEVLPGTLVVREGRIAEVQPGRSHAPGAIDLDGDHLMPGVIDVHTDNLERQVQPRATARWPSRSAFMSHDAQTAAAGVTTVLDALCLGDLGFDAQRTETFLDGVRDLDALAPTGLLKSEHFLHLRCELPAADLMPLLDTVADHPAVRMVSLMDHSPGVGQYVDVERYRAMRAKSLPLEEVERRIDHLLAQRERLLGPQRRALLERFAGRDLPLASHDDWREDEIAQNEADGIMISEFPVSMLAAEAARRHGMQIIAGAPNLVRGGSHSGNVAASDLVRSGLVDVFASDYVPPAMIEAVWRAAAETGLSLPRAIATITDAPARMLKMHDRGRIEAGRRADLVRIRPLGDMPVVRSVWRAGERVA
ncbi:alpha-D-ribose 1-methylphosphonate 5-triphosphate diphosphatase [Pseudoroseomonas wenyumeiae]|uniref:Alpha-D-ribose 1-methylphosphonate 5-triphosphate diphosphatase n=1 Tax=Teichococcus wenyumeiae TaxID=2478470 RepID=A0A3A9JKL2_9PROT|nr:alpha-D-ribose 1-methylphosphonate 5-triphosphate diphosphatase [Pseudoroseomonas wenyumeiae]RKK05323.1 alpha-D-ribose 1-methylphosphonate 5-triphosphate diphosphatase [Pseudoroseomonas wenyumeiae]RMI25526.1 alpha-D-ribose 1-methylphosphonate 5-triphosphate diphosphatase [Pseudoroseomonas wenyumeiae]